MVPCSNIFCRKSAIFLRLICLIGLVLHRVATKFKKLGRPRIPLQDGIPLTLLSRGHTTNKCWPTCVCLQCWQTKSVMCSKSWQTFYVGQQCWPCTILFFFVGQQAANHALWLLGSTIIVLYIYYTSPFYLCVIHSYTQTDFGRLRFRLSPVYSATTQLISTGRRVELSCVAINGALQAIKQIKCWPTFVGRVSAALTGCCIPWFVSNVLLWSLSWRKCVCVCVWLTADVYFGSVKVGANTC